MALSEADIDELCDRVLHGSQERYLAEMADAIVAHLSQGMAGKWDRAALVQLASEWPSKARQIMAEYGPLVGKEVAAEVGDALASSAMADLLALGAAYGASAVSEQLSSHFRRLADQAAQRVASIVQRNNLAMEANAERAWYEVVEDAVNAKVLGTKTHDQIVADAVQRLGDSFRVTYQSGRKVPVDAAIRTHIATQASQAGGELTIEAMRSFNHQLAVTDAHYGARPSHAEWQGLPFGIDGPCEVDGVEYPGMKELTGYGSPGGLKGVNCRHIISPYFPDITELPDREFKAEREKWGMDSDEYYKLQQRQRAWERRIRSTKRQIADMERAGLGLESPSYVQKRLLLGQQQKAVRELCRRHKLTRRLEREKAYGVKTQPRALSGAGWKASYGVRESLVPKSTEKGNLYDVNRRVVNSKRYHDKYESLKFPKAVRESLYRNAGRMLAERNGTDCERFAVVNARSGDIVADTFGHEPTPHGARLKPTESKRASECADGVVTVHNHPASVYPSYADIKMTVANRNVRGSIVACHDGDVYLIEADKNWAGMEKRYWEIYTEARRMLISREETAKVALSKLEKENEVMRWFKITRL